MTAPDVWLDLCCCEGGASEGFRRAGFAVVGVDLFEDYTRARYPFPAWTGDARDALDLLLHGETLRFTGQGETVDLALDDLAGISASPPCQHATAGTRALRKTGAKEYPRLIEPLRDRLERTGRPYIIENVRGADLVDPLELCGCMFGRTAVDTDGTILHLRRPRRFESNLNLTAPRPCDHAGQEWIGGVYGGARRDKWEAKYVRHGGYVPPDKAVAEALLGIDWMTWKGLYQAIPPDYTEHLGNQVRAYLDANAVFAGQWQGGAA